MAVRRHTRSWFLALILVGCGGAPISETTPEVTQDAPSPERAKFDARLSLYEYPFEVKTFEFQSQGQALEMMYMDVSPTGPANGETALLLHGKNFSGAYWASTAKLLAERGYRVVIPDQVGFGKSSKPTGYQYSFHGLASNTRALLETLGVEKTAVVGHSMGGMLATRFALSYPEQTSKLVLVNPIGLEDYKRLVPYPGVDRIYEGERKKTPESVRDYMKASYFDGTWKPEYDDLAAIQMGWAARPGGEGLAMVAALSADMIYTQPVVYEFEDITVPTLLIVGTRDRTALGKNLVDAETAAGMGLYEKLGPKTQQAIPGSVLVEIPGVGHIPQVEAWDAYKDALTSVL